MSGAAPLTGDSLPTQDVLRRDLRQLIRRSCPRLPEDALVDERRFSDLGVASIEVMCIVFEIEEAYSLDIVGAGLDDFETLGDMLAVVHRLLFERERQP